MAELTDECDGDVHAAFEKLQHDFWGANEQMLKDMERGVSDLEPIVNDARASATLRDEIKRIKSEVKRLKTHGRVVRETTIRDSFIDIIPNGDPWKVWKAVLEEKIDKDTGDLLSPSAIEKEILAKCLQVDVKSRKKKKTVNVNSTEFLMPPSRGQQAPSEVQGSVHQMGLLPESTTCLRKEGLHYRRSRSLFFLIE